MRTTLLLVVCLRLQAAETPLPPSQTDLAWASQAEFAETIAPVDRAQAGLTMESARRNPENASPLAPDAALQEIKLTLP